MGQKEVYIKKQVIMPWACRLWMKWQVEGSPSKFHQLEKWKQRGMLPLKHQLCRWLLVTMLAGLKK